MKQKYDPFSVKINFFILSQKEVGPFHPQGLPVPTRFDTIPLYSILAYVRIVTDRDSQESWADEDPIKGHCSLRVVGILVGHKSLPN